jgi:tetratricopeptide (TPR) repeat protein
MATMAAEQGSASPPQEYLAIFHRYITRSIEAVSARIAPEPEELSAEIREQAWHLLDYGLKLTHAWEAARTLLLLLAPRMEKDGFRQEWLPHLEGGVACSRHMKDAKTEAQLGLHIGRLYRLRGDIAEAHKWFTASADLYQQLGDAQGRATALNQLAYVARLQSRNDEARTHLAEALSLLDVHDTERATSFWVLGTLAQAAFQWAEAEQFHRDALQVWQQAGNQQRAAWSLQNLGDTLRGAGKYAEAAAYIEQAILLLGQLHDPVNQAIARMNLGILHLYDNEPAQALALSTLAEAVFRQVGDQWHLAMVYTNITIAERELGHWQQAEQAGKHAIRLWDLLGNLKFTANAMDELGLTYLAEGNRVEAIETFERAIALLSPLPPDPFRDMVHDSLLSHLEEAQKIGSG